MSFSTIPLRSFRSILSFPMRAPRTKEQTLKIMNYYAAFGALPQTAHWFNHLRQASGSQGVSLEGWEALTESAAKSQNVVFLDMVCKALAKENITPSLRLRRLLISGFSNVNELGKSKQLFEDLVKEGVTPPQSIVDTMKAALKQHNQKDFMVTTFIERFGMVREPQWQQEEQEREEASKHMQLD